MSRGNARFGAKVVVGGFAVLVVAAAGCRNYDNGYVVTGLRSGNAVVIDEPIWFGAYWSYSCDTGSGCGLNTSGNGCEESTCYEVGEFAVTCTPDACELGQEAGGSAAAFYVVPTALGAMVIHASNEIAKESAVRRTYGVDVIERADVTGLRLTCPQGAVPRESFQIDVRGVSAEGDVYVSQGTYHTNLSATALAFGDSAVSAAAPPAGTLQVTVTVSALGHEASCDVAFAP